MVNFAMFAPLATQSSAMSKVLVQTYPGCTKYCVDVCLEQSRFVKCSLDKTRSFRWTVMRGTIDLVKSTVALAAVLSSRLPRSTDLTEGPIATLHSLHCAAEKTAILGRASRLAYATKTLCDIGSTVKV